jgi:hypothetical protein
MSSLSRFLLACVFSALTATASAQLVADGATNVVNNTTNVVANNLTVGAAGSHTALIITNTALVIVRTNATIGEGDGAVSNWVQVTVNSRFEVGSDLVVGREGRENHPVMAGTIKSVAQTRAVGARVCDPQQFRQAERLGRNGTVRLSEVLRLTERSCPTLLIAPCHGSGQSACSTFAGGVRNLPGAYWNTSGMERIYEKQCYHLADSGRDYRSD